MLSVASTYDVTDDYVIQTETRLNLDTILSVNIKQSCQSENEVSVVKKRPFYIITFAIPIKAEYKQKLSK